MLTRKTHHIYPQTIREMKRHKIFESFCFLFLSFLSLQAVLQIILIVRACREFSHHNFGEKGNLNVLFIKS